MIFENPWLSEILTLQKLSFVVLILPLIFLLLETQEIFDGDRPVEKACTNDFKSSCVQIDCSQIWFLQLYSKFQSSSKNEDSECDSSYAEREFTSTEVTSVSLSTADYWIAEQW